MKNLSNNIPIIILTLLFFISCDIGRNYCKIGKSSIATKSNDNDNKHNLISNPPFAIHGFEELREGDEDDYRNVKNLGVKFIRLAGTKGMLWDKVESHKPLGSGNYNWIETDHAVDDLVIKQGFKIFWTINPFNSIDQNSKTPLDKKMPINMGYYLQFLRAAVERYDGDGIDDAPGSPVVNHWQIHNELNVSFFWGDGAQKYAQLYKESYDVIKSSNPNAKVAIGGMANPNGLKDSECNYQDIVSEIKLLGGDIDIFDFHWYGYIGNYLQHFRGGSPLKEFIAEDLAELLEGFENVEIWTTETGTYVGADVNGKGDNTLQPQTEHEQAIELIKRYVHFTANGVKKVFWVSVLEQRSSSTETHNDLYDNTGLIYNGFGSDEDPGFGIKKLSYYTYKLMSEKLDGFNWNSIELVKELNGTYIYKFTNINNLDEHIWVAWSDSGSSKISLSTLGIQNATVTETVPSYVDGEKIIDDRVLDKNLFKKYNTSKSIQIKDVPLFIERY